MIFVKINNENYPCEVQSFTTQFGKGGLRIISSEAPIAENGFMIIDENDNLITDCTKYTYLYRETDEYKEYTTAIEEIVPVECFSVGDLPENPLNILLRQISGVNNKINDITPYTETKTAYIDDTEVIFNIAKEGNISIFMTDNEGQDVPCTFEKVNGQIIVSFEKRETLATVTISIQ